jgi:RHS repeat-associated protein
MTYDIRGNLLKVVDALDRPAFLHVFDLANYKLRVDSIDAGVRRSVLDATGNVIEARDSKGALILRAYDALHRPIRLWARDQANERITLRERLEYGDGGDPSQPVADRDESQASNSLGKLGRHFDEAGLLAFLEYDFKGNVLEKTRQVISDASILRVFATPRPDGSIEAFRVDWDDPASTQIDDQIYATSILYDALSRIKRLTYPEDVEGSRRQLRPTYNRAGALERVALDGDQYVERIAYNAKGQRVFIAYGNRVLTRYAYDMKTFRLARMCTEHYEALGELIYEHTDPILQDYEYSYDLVGNIVSIHDRASDCGVPNTELGINALNRDFSYDPLYRLRSATGRETDFPAELPWDPKPRSVDLMLARSYSERYLYDDVSNMKELKHLARSGGFTRALIIARDSNRLDTIEVGADKFQYVYDANGNMIHETTSRHFEWDHSDRMRLFRTEPMGGEASLHAHYLYDAAGQRTKKVIRLQGGQVRATVYIGDIFEHSFRNGSENNLHHVMDCQRRVGVVRSGSPFPNDATPPVTFHYDDHSGNSSVLVGGQTAAQNRLINREEYSPYGESVFGAVEEKRYRFAGKERDDESGLTYVAARYLAVWTARWSSCDKLALSEGLNLFTYVRNNPVTMVDRNGKQALNASDAGAPTPGGGSTEVAGAPTPPDEDASGTRHPDEMAGLTALPAALGKGLNVPKPVPPRTVVRKVDPANPAQANPDIYGMEPTNPESSGGLADHALNQPVIQQNGSRYLSASTNPEGAPNIKGKPYWIDVDKLPEGATVHSNAEIAEDIQGKVTTGEIPQDRADKWHGKQPTEQEVLIEAERVPPKAVTSIPPRPSWWAQTQYYGVQALELYGHFLGVLGAHVEAKRSASLVGDDQDTRNAAYVSTFVGALIGAKVDDALAVMPWTNPLVMNSWETNGSGPTQALVGDLLRKYNAWAQRNNLP